MQALPKKLNLKNAHAHTKMYRQLTPIYSTHKPVAHAAHATPKYRDGRFTTPKFQHESAGEDMHSFHANQRHYHEHQMEYHANQEKLYNPLSSQAKAHKDQRHYHEGMMQHHQYETTKQVHAGKFY